MGIWEWGIYGLMGGGYLWLKWVGHLWLNGWGIYGLNGWSIYSKVSFIWKYAGLQPFYPF